MEDPCNCCCMSKDSTFSHPKESLFCQFTPLFSPHPSALFPCLSFRQNATETTLKVKSITLGRNTSYFFARIGYRDPPLNH